MDGPAPPETTKRPKSGAERTCAYRQRLDQGVRYEAFATWEQIDKLTLAGQLPLGVEDNLPALRVELSRLNADYMRRMIPDDEADM